MGNVIFCLITLFIVTADQWTKHWISSVLQPGQAMWEFGFFRFYLAHNTGAAFSLFQNLTSALTVIRMIGALIVLVIVIFWNRRIQDWGGKWVMLALGLILGGTIGNLVDTIRLGYVVDFVDLTYWPVFNVADSSVVVSMFILGILLIRQMIAERKK